MFAFSESPAGTRARVGAQEAQAGAQGAQVEAEKSRGALTDLEAALLAACRLEPRTGKELLQAAGYKSRTGNFKRALQHLLDLGFLELSVPGRPRSSKQRYRVTSAGLDRLARAEARGRKP